MSSDRPITAAKLISAKIIALAADEKISDVQLALDVTAAFISSLGLGPSDRLSSCKEQACAPPSMH